MIRIFLLHGGIYSFDGIITSAGMNMLANMLRQMDSVLVQTYLWANWTTTYHDVMANQEDKIVLVGYSGGGMKCTWIANGCILVNGRIVYAKRPRIDLLVAYDPSPAESVQELHNNVGQAICYHNNRPMMFGLGGGKLKGACVLSTVEISEQHLMVQWDQSLHRQTVAAVRSLAT